MATDRGKELLAHYEHRVAEAEADLLASLDPAAATALTNLMGHLAIDVH